MQVPSTALVNCTGAETCVELYDSQCVVYNGPALASISTTPGQRLLVILQNISAAIAAGGSGGGSGSGNAILNQNTSVQAGASYWIDGTGHANTYQADSVVLVGATDGSGALMVVNPDEINSQLPEGSGSFALSATSGSLNINGPSGNGSATLNFSGLFINDTQGGSLTVVPSGIFLTADSNSGGSVNVSAGLFTTTDSNGDSIYYTVNGGQATLFGTPANLNINYNNVIVNGGMSVENAPVNPTDVVRLMDLSGGGGGTSYNFYSGLWNDGSGNIALGGNQLSADTQIDTSNLFSITIGDASGFTQTQLFINPRNGVAVLSASSGTAFVAFDNGSSGNYTGFQTTISGETSSVYINGDQGTGNGIIIKDNIWQAGISEFADYSANYTDLSLVNKGWVLSQLGGGGPASLTLAGSDQTVTQTPTFSNGLVIESHWDWYSFTAPSDTGSFVNYVMFVSAATGGVTAGSSVSYDVNSDTLHANNFSVSGSILASFTPFSGLPASPTVGMIQAISDSTVNTWGTIIAGGGSYPVIGYYNGTNWTVTSA